MKTSLAHVQSSIQATDTFECGTLTSTVAGRSPQQLGGGYLCSEDQEQLVIDEVQKHYKNRQSPYYLAELGKFFRTQKIEVPVGVRFKDFLKSRFDGSLLILQDPIVPAKIAIAPPEEQERVLQQLTGRYSETPGDSGINVTRLPFALVAAFCIKSISHNQVYFRTVRPFRYVTGLAAPDDTYIEIDEEFRSTSLVAMSVHNLSPDEKQEIYRRIIQWASAKGVDLRTFYHETRVESVRNTSKPGALAANALQRLVEAQEPELRKRIQIPGDVAIALMRLP